MHYFLKEENYSTRKIIVLILLLISTVNGEGLINGPEGIVYDSLTNRYLIANVGNGSIVEINDVGEEKLFASGLHNPLGLNIRDGNIYVSNNSDPKSVIGYNLTTGKKIFNLKISEALSLSGICSDNDANLFVVDQSGKIFKISISDSSYSVFVSSGLPAGTQGILFDENKNRLIVNGFQVNPSIVEIDIVTKSITTHFKSIGQFSAITSDKDGFIYVCSWNTNKVYKFDSDFSIDPIVVSEHHSQPTGLCITEFNNMLAVSNFGSSTIDFIELPEHYLYMDFNFNKTTGNIPLEVQFEDLSITNQNIISWSWDFNNDGVEDSKEENPKFIYNFLGTYSVSLEITTENETKEFILDSIITTFNGETSLNQNRSNSLIKILPKEELNLKDEWTFEAWIKPTNLHGKYVLDKQNVKIYTNRSSGQLAKNSLVIRLIKENESTITFSTEESSLTVSEWQNISVAYNYENKIIETTVNGKLQKLSMELNSIFESPIKDNESDTLYLGNNVTGYRSLMGQLDEVRIWNRALVIEELEENRFKYLLGNEKNLAGYWNLNEGNGNIALDQTEFKNNGIIQNSSYTEGIDYNSLVDVPYKSGINIMSTEFQLYQNFPNPFNPTTEINYSIPEKGFVQLKIYDFLGREVLEYKEYMPKGNHSFSFNGDKMTSGIYFYTLAFGDRIESRKMLLLK